jgi:hypothetical protein
LSTLSCSLVGCFVAVAMRLTLSSLAALA